MLPSMAYDCASVLPAAGSTVKAATAMNEAASSGRTGGRAPRAMAIRPAATPTAAMTAALHRVNSTKSPGRPSDTHHGGPPAGVCRMAGTLIDGPATDTAIITRSETVMQAAAVQTSPRVTPAARLVPSLTVFTPQMRKVQNPTRFRVPPPPTGRPYPIAPSERVKAGLGPARS